MAMLRRILVVVLALAVEPLFSADPSAATVGGDSPAGDEPLPAHIGPYLGSATYYSGAVSASEAEYLASLADVVARHIRYPKNSIKLGEEGSAVSRVRFNRDGIITAVSVIKKTGYSRLDVEANNVFVRVARFPEVPADCMPGEDSFELDLPVKFSLLK
ncbi:MAG: transport protein TonB [Nevskia sp.]|nr:transport protein TonB [Nevskia sp.]